MSTKLDNIKKHLEKEIKEVGEKALDADRNGREQDFFYNHGMFVAYKYALLIVNKQFE